MLIDNMVQLLHLLALTLVLCIGCLVGGAPVAETQSNVTAGLTYIVVLKAPGSWSAISGADDEARRTRVRRVEHTLTHDYAAVVIHRYDFESFLGFSMRIGSRGSVESIRALPEVDYVEPNGQCTVAASQPVAPWNLVRVNRRSPTASTNFHYDDMAGAGVDIVILDTGIFRNHSEFEARVVFGASFSRNPKDAGLDPNGHGTHVAGIAAGRTLGIAKKASLVDVQVMGSDGSGTWADVIAGIHWTVRRAVASMRAKKTVINISITGPPSRALVDAIARAMKAGIHIVVAAGNFGTDACQQSPANSPAMSVGSIGSLDDMSAFSNHGPCVDIFAPGDSILSAWIDGPYSTAYLSGTSMSSPMVAGSKALFLARREYEPEVLDALIVRATTKNAIRGLPDDRGRTANRLLFVPSRVDRAEDALEQQAEDESAWNESEDGVQVRADKFHFQI